MGKRAFVVLLRGVNVGRSGRMTMASLREALAQAGYDDAETYLQSGNVVVSASGPAVQVSQAVEAAIAQHLGFTTDAIVRTQEQMRAIAQRAPLADDDPSRLAVGFCKARPQAAAVRGLHGRDFGSDVAQVRGSEVFLWYPNGMGRSKLTGTVLERALGVSITVRNWKVVQELARLAQR